MSGLLVSWLWFLGFGFVFLSSGSCRERLARFAGEIAHDLLKTIERLVEIVPRNDERRREPHHGVVRLLREHALGHEPLAGGARAGKARVDVNAGPKATAAHVLDRRAV